MSEVKRNARRGSRLELAVVVFVAIVFLLMLMPLYGKVSDGHWNHDSTQAMIMSLAGGLERYRVVFDCYPPSPTTSGTEDDGTLYTYLNGPDGRGVVENRGRRNEHRYEPFLSLNARFYKFVNEKLVVVDFWGMPIHYFNCKAFVEEQHGNPKFCHNPASVDIYSTGQDKKKDADLVEPGTAEVQPPGVQRLTDDITNWR